MNSRRPGDGPRIENSVAAKPGPPHSAITLWGAQRKPVRRRINQCRARRFDALLQPETEPGPHSISAPASFGILFLRPLAADLNTALPMFTKTRLAPVPKTDTQSLGVAADDRHVLQAGHQDAWRKSAQRSSRGFNTADSAPTHTVPGRYRQSLPAIPRTDRIRRLRRSLKFQYESSASKSGGASFCRLRQVW